MAIPCLDAALEYIERDWSVIPLAPRGKKPLIGWLEYQRRIAAEEEVYDWWERWPEANVGIVTGTVSGLAVADADGPQGLAWIKSHMPTTGAYSRTAKGWHALYSLNPGMKVENAVRLATEVDVRGEGGYIVAPPSVHATGHVYKWVLTPGCYGFDDLALWPAEIGQKKNGSGKLNLDLSGVKTTVRRQEVKKGERNNYIASQAGVLLNQGLDFDQALVLLLEENKKLVPPLGESEIRATLRSIYNTDVRKHPERHSSISVEEVRQPDPKPAPQELPDAPKPQGLLERIAQYVQDISPVSYPAFDLGASICILGGIVGQKVMTETGLRTNFYFLALAYSGTGKNGPLSAIPMLLKHSGMEALKGPTTLASGPALYKMLATSNRKICYWDEIGDIIASLKSPDSPLKDLLSGLKEIFSSTDRSLGKSYAQSQLSYDIHWHHLTLYATGTPSRFWSGLQSTDLMDGFIGRTIIVTSLHAGKLPEQPKISVPPRALLDDLKMLRDYPFGGMDGNSDHSLAGTAVMIPKPLTIPKTDRAADAFLPWRQKYFDLAQKFRESRKGEASVYNRAAEHASKLALVHAISRAGVIYDGQLVEQVDIEWAMNYVDWFVPNMIKQIRENVHENEFDRETKTILKKIEQAMLAGEVGASKRDLYRTLHKPRRQLDELLASLIDAGEIGRVAQKTGKPGPSPEYFCLVKE